MLALANSPSTENLCSKCLRIDFNSLLSTSSEGPLLGQVARFRKGDCILCGFFRDVLPAEAKLGDYVYTSYRLRSVRSVAYDDHNVHHRLNHRPSQLPETWAAVDAMLLRLDPIPNKMDEITNGPGIPYILPRYPGQHDWFQPLRSCIDFDMVRQWLRACSSWHSNKCVSGSKPTSLTLIDCTNRTLDTIENQTYVALSYVWGSEAQASDLDSSVSTKSNCLPNSLPRNIEDAMYVTTELGFRYLWVDKYCIDQSNSTKMAAQIAEMDLIYRCADLTLIDAAGKNPHEGLPGARPSAHSRRQPLVRVRDLELVSTMQRPEWHIKKSPWNHRAWTYQEGLLSFRKLVFTPQQVYFQCQGMSCKEALDFPLDGLLRLHSQANRRFRDKFYQPQSMAVFPQNGIGKHEWDIYARIQDYSGRELSYDGDILNGILGLFRHWASHVADPPLQHLCGLPFQRFTNPEDNLYLDFWASKNRILTLLDSLRWNLTRPSPRRVGFPSWSWTGWYGKVKWPSEFSPSNKKAFKDEKRFLFDIDINLHTNVSIMTGLDDTSPSLNTTHLDSLCSTQYLSIKAPTFPLERLNPEEDESALSPRFALPVSPRQNRQNAIVDCTATTVEFLDVSEIYMAVQLSQTPSKVTFPGDGFFDNCQIEILIVMRLEDRWERVAYGSYHSYRETQMRYSWTKLILG